MDIIIDTDLMLASPRYDFGVERICMQAADGGTLRFHGEQYARRRGLNGWAAFVNKCRKEVRK